MSDKLNDINDKIIESLNKQLKIKSAMIELLKQQIEVLKKLYNHE